MAISLTRAQQHVEEWSRALTGATDFWPKLLYHTADLTAIPTILRSGYLIPRGAQQQIICDVAAQEPLWRNPAAHKYGRFYFRPKTLFHVVKEGIRCLQDSNRPPTQMSIPIILGFDAPAVLSKEEIFFTRMKFANRDEEIGNNTEFFDSIDFSAVYHNSPTQSKEVRHQRMAEALHLGNLPLEGYLKFLICRTAYDRISLMAMLTPQERILYGPKIKIEKLTGTFFVHDYSLYVKNLKFYNGVLLVTLKHATARGVTAYKCKVKQFLPDWSLIQELDIQLPLSFTASSINGFQNIPDCVWQIYLEDALAFVGPIPSENSQLL